MTFNTRSSLVAIILVASCHAVAQRPVEVVAPQRLNGISEAIALCPKSAPCIVDVQPGLNEVDHPIAMRSNLTIRSLTGQNDVSIRYRDTGDKPAGLISANGPSTLVGVIDGRQQAQATRINHEGRLSAGDLLAVTASPNGQLVDAQVDQAAGSTFQGSTPLVFPLGRPIDPLTRSYYLFKVAPYSNVRFENLTFLIAPNQPVVCQRFANSTFAGCVFARQDADLGPVLPNVYYYGLNLGGSYHCAIRNCTFTEVDLRVTYSTDVAVTGCSFQRAPMGECVLSGSNSCLVASNVLNGDWQDHAQLPPYVMVGQNGDGITLIRSWNNTVSGNMIANTSCYGIWLNNGCGANVVQANTVQNTYTYCLCDTDGVGNELSRNVLYPVGARPYVDANGIVHQGGWSGGICIEPLLPAYPTGAYTAKHLISDNYISGGGLGIYVAGSTGVHVRSNTAVGQTLAPLFAVGNDNFISEFNNF